MPDVPVYEKENIVDAAYEKSHFAPDFLGNCRSDMSNAEGNMIAHRDVFQLSVHLIIKLYAL